MIETNKLLKEAKELDKKLQKDGIQCSDTVENVISEILQIKNPPRSGRKNGSRGIEYLLD